MFVSFEELWLCCALDMSWLAVSLQIGTQLCSTVSYLFLDDLIFLCVVIKEKGFNISLLS